MDFDMLHLPRFWILSLYIWFNEKMTAVALKMLYLEDLALTERSCTHQKMNRLILTNYKTKIWYWYQTINKVGTKAWRSWIEPKRLISKKNFWVEGPSDIDEATKNEYGANNDTRKADRISNFLINFKDQYMPKWNAIHCRGALLMGETRR